ncbi:MAG: AmmeMemoRadiSam system protein A [Bacteroidales bacterium]|nr:AmmeMemoRadiSam system protein A [Bacteroidales bacterium]MDD3151298.1 AmmeMemoRadiSam system protein A [Bacteroidales bacterium]MDD3914370.1 AmmeMemoRadiSam system protein A [Bacteroidales bacterium]MDD4633464.1 AmmeMemoRadiSam system protein A [Bacteroidales bacterium]
MSVVAAFIMPHPPVILPQIGCGEEKKIQKTIDACREVARRVTAIKPQTIVLTSPHSIMYADYFHISPGMRAAGSFGQFRHPEVAMEVDYDTDFVRKLAAKAEKADLPAGTLGERDKTLDHGTMIPLSFINEQYQDYELVRIGLSGLPPIFHYQLGKLIAETADELGRNVVFIASGDLSHKLLLGGPYGFAAEGSVFDEQVTQAMDNGDFLQFLSFNENFCDAAAECGLRSFQIMAGAFDGKAVQSQLLSYQGTFGIGYGVAAFTAAGNDASRHFDEIYQQQYTPIYDMPKMDPYVRLAKYSLETYINTGKRATMPADLPKEMLNKKAGVFVSLKEYGQLRGCIGTIAPVTSSVAAEIMCNAVSAGCEDPRFDAVKSKELPLLVYSVDILDDPEDIDDASQLDVKRYGVIVSNGLKRGLLLPNIEGVDTVQQQIDIARRKAGIDIDKPIHLQRFEVVRHK